MLIITVQKKKKKKGIADAFVNRICHGNIVIRPTEIFLAAVNAIFVIYTPRYSRVRGDKYKFRVFRVFVITRFTYPTRCS